MSTPRGGQYKLRLADGTDVWLNAASTIRYPTDFKGKERRVEISGEVYFEVTHQQSADGKQVPFFVDILPTPLQSKSTIEVLGTHFNINAYPDELIVKTTLLQGSVKVSHGAASEILSPGQQARINDLADNVTISVADNADTEEAVAWKNGLFQFNKTDIQTLMRQLARWYDIDVRYEGPIPGLLTTGKAPRDISLNSMLKILALSDVHFKIDGKNVTVMP
jgi:ferric-dicitrate binding protein FerR (iron transport regulator)